MKIKINSTVKNLLKALFWLLMTFGWTFLIYKFGLGAAVKVSEFLQNRQPATEDALTDNYLPEPKFLSVPTATNSAELPVSGYSLANKEVELTLNNVEKIPFSVNSEGKFEGTISLALGENSFSAVTKDFNGKTSASSSPFTVFYSDTPPALDILDPIDGSTIKNNPNISIKGKTDAGIKVYINDHLTIINEKGEFSYPVVLKKGENKFKVVSLDPAQNKTEIEIIYQFRP